MPETVAAQNDWRRITNPDDMLSAVDSLCSKDDFSGRAALYETALAAEPLPIDLFVQTVNLSIGEHIQTVSYIGDIFGAVAYGKSPLFATVSCVLAESSQNYGKQYLTDAYKNKLRLSAVSLTGKVPAFRWLDCAITGPCVSMRCTTSSTNEDTVIVVLTFLVINMVIITKEDSLFFDYARGVDSQSGEELEVTEATYRGDGPQPQEETQQWATKKEEPMQWATKSQSTAEPRQPNKDPQVSIQKEV